MERLSDIEALLSQQAMFRSLESEQLNLLAQRCRKIRVPKNKYVFRKGEVAEGIYVVAVGQIMLTIPSSSQHQEKVIEFFGAGQTFGEAMMLLDRPFMVDAMALEDAMLLLIEKQAIISTLDTDPMFARRMLAGLSVRLHALMQDIASVNLQNSIQRVAAYLLSQPREGNKTSFTCNKNLIASKLGITPETFSRVLNQLTQKKLISVEGKDVLIHDIDAIQQVVFSLD
ncbi:Crp/Fnr family transcriptional regulator [Burkholderiaceae bacterium DAT-1]|nr:Crp/Fnr family transcriptional regulator [Burkholderiaceae bacterium DAT-1]